MKIVGDHLGDFALKSGSEIHCDLFGRSAYNRYYYSAFLCVRAALKTIDSRWATPTHQDVPRVLIGEVLHRLKRHIQLARDSNQINHTQGEQMYHAAASAASELSNLLRSAREIRRVADYEPEQPVSKVGSQLKLRGYTLDTAKGWTQRAETQVKTILRVYGQLGVI